MFITYIRRLHMLQELEEYIISLNIGSKQLYRHNKDSWRARFALTQVIFIVILGHEFIY